MSLLLCIYNTSTIISIYIVFSNIYTTFCLIKQLTSSILHYLLLQHACVHWGKHFPEHPGWHADCIRGATLGMANCTLDWELKKFIGIAMLGALSPPTPPFGGGCGAMQHRGAQSARHVPADGDNIGSTTCWGMQQRGAHEGWQNCWDDEEGEDERNEESGGASCGLNTGCWDLDGQHFGAHDRLHEPSSKSSGGLQHLGRQAG